MIMIRYVCDRCKATWEEQPNANRPHEKYAVTEYVKSDGKKFGRYENRTLCSRCLSALDDFLNMKEPEDKVLKKAINRYFVGEVSDEVYLGLPLLLTLHDVNSLTEAGYKVVTLESFLKKGE